MQNFAKPDLRQLAGTIPAVRHAPCDTRSPSSGDQSSLVIPIENGWQVIAGRMAPAAKTKY
ncbi:MAG TPA: hypothetical protein DEF45_25835 [Rhodopirellula sp.]|nr:hypothetical protein [Rhodopirellula sp.]